MARANVHERTVAGFGEEWERFDQRDAPTAELDALFESYFAVFPWDRLARDAVGFDAGCGSGRWAARVAPRVGHLHCFDASPAALAVARRTLSTAPNCSFAVASVDSLPVADGSMDFAYSLGVLHHVPDTAAAIAACARKLKPGAPLLLYLYYAFDNRPAWFRELWRASDRVRRRVSRLPAGFKQRVTDAIAAAVYLPLARTARLAERVGLDVSHFPLAAYRSRSFYNMRTDALDRFGTELEQRFTRSEIERLMQAAGLERIAFHHGPPYWCALGYRA